MSQISRKNNCAALLRIADNALKTQDVSSAQEAYLNVLKQFPSNKKALAKLKLLRSQAVSGELEKVNKLISERKFSECLRHCHILLKNNIKSAELYKITSQCYFEEKNVSETITYIKLSLSENNNQPELFNILGSLYTERNQLTDAFVAFQNAVKLKPHYIEARNNLALTLHNIGEHQKAAKEFRKAISANPNNAVFHFNIANLYRDMDDTINSKKHYFKSIALNSNLPEAFNNLGMLFWNQGDIKEAYQYWKIGIKNAPENIDLISNIGAFYWVSSEPKMAETYWLKGLQLSPGNTTIVAQYCEMLEKLNRLDEIAFLLNSASSSTNDILFLNARLKFRQKNYDEALDIYKQIDPLKLSPQKVPFYYTNLGILLEKFGKFDEAFRAFEKKNRYIETQLDYDNTSRDLYRKSKASDIKNLKYAKQLRSPNRANMQNASIQYSFMIGFPRSGTTLLDTILRSHSKIDVLEETTCLEKSISKVNNFNWNLAKGSEDPLVQAREIYQKEVTKFKTSGTDCLVDKMPLHIFDIPKISKIFPNSKFILALRHPLDSILSCWSQSFKLNSAMSNFTRLETTVELYCLAMDMFLECQKRLDIDVFKIKYEELVLDFELNIQNLLKFLGLEWEETVQEYQKTALERSIINTPSYSQVTQALYTGSIDRWQNYNVHFQPYKEKVAKYCDEFSYSL